MCMVVVSTRSGFFGLKLSFFGTSCPFLDSHLSRWFIQMIIIKEHNTASATELDFGHAAM